MEADVRKSLQSIATRTDDVGLAARDRLEKEQERDELGRFGFHAEAADHHEHGGSAATAELHQQASDTHQRESDRLWNESRPGK